MPIFIIVLLWELDQLGQKWHKCKKKIIMSRPWLAKLKKDDKARVWK